MWLLAVDNLHFFLVASIWPSTRVNLLIIGIFCFLEHLFFDLILSRELLRLNWRLSSLWLLDYKRRPVVKFAQFGWIVVLIVFKLLVETACLPDWLRLIERHGAVVVFILLQDLASCEFGLLLLSCLSRIYLVRIYLLELHLSWLLSASHSKLLELGSFLAVFNASTESIAIVVVGLSHLNLAACVGLDVEVVVRLELQSWHLASLIRQAVVGPVLIERIG